MIDSVGASDSAHELALTLLRAPILLPGPTEALPRLYMGANGSVRHDYAERLHMASCNWRPSGWRGAEL